MMDYGPDNAPNYPPSQQQPAPQPAVTHEKKTNIFAILSLVFCLTILGLIFGIIALVQIRKDPYQKGKGLAIAGMVISIVTAILTILMVVMIMSYRFAYA